MSQTRLVHPPEQITDHRPAGLLLDCAFAQDPIIIELVDGSIALFAFDTRIDKSHLYLGWSWLEWGGVGLARLQFWLQKAHFGLFGKDRIIVSY